MSYIKKEVEIVSLKGKNDEGTHLAGVLASLRNACADHVVSDASSVLGIAFGVCHGGHCYLEQGARCGSSC